MSLGSNIIFNMYSIIIICIIYFHVLRTLQKESLQDKLYIMILYITALMLCFDILSRLDGNSSPLYPVMNKLGNFLIFLTGPLLPSLWAAYVCQQIYSKGQGVRRLYYFLCSINIINAVLLICSQFFGWFYYIDSNNIYHRGPYFCIPVFTVSVLVLLVFIITLTNRKKLGKKSFLSLIFFAVPPSICIILQVRFYGISLVLNSIVPSLLVVLLNVQNRNIYIDHLTHVYNRKKLDEYLRKKVHSSISGRGFSAIMIDINNFKGINDTYGHDIGDEALETVAKLLKSCLGRNDFIARYGGDEFCLILDMSNKKDLKAAADKINGCFERYNESDSVPYSLAVSMGYAVYDQHESMDAEEFLKQIDRLMYQEKQAHRNNLSRHESGEPMAQT